jgi:hypothetical protein
MKKNSRLYGISLALCGLVCFFSCNKDEDKTETLAAPTNLTASSVTSNSAAFSWTSNAASFEIKVGDQTYTSSVSSYALGNLSPNTTYSWSVKAVKGDISSEWAAGPGFVTLEGTSPPAPPTGLTVSSITTTGAVISWTSDATSFDIEVGSNTYTATTNSYTLTGLTANTAYNWKVRAKKNSATSDWATNSFTTSSGGLAWNELIATMSTTWWLADGSNSVNTLVNQVDDNISDMQYQYTLTLYAITLDEPPFTNLDGRSITFVVKINDGSDNSYAAGQYLYDFTPTGNNLALEYTGEGATGDYFLDACSPLLDAFNSKSPYSITGDDFESPTTVTFTSAADPDFWFTVEI